MPSGTGKQELGRGERVLPGVWRLRLPLPYPGVPHCNAWAVAAGDGVVLFDTGMHEPGSMGHLERAMEQVDLGVEHVRPVVCTQSRTAVGREGAQNARCARCGHVPTRHARTRWLSGRLESPCAAPGAQPSAPLGGEGAPRLP